MVPTRSRRRGTAVAVVLLLLTVLALGAAACGTTSTTSSSGSSAAPPTTTENVPDDNTPAKKVFKADDTDIKVLVGEKFGIRLDENASIGDKWVVISQPDPSYLKDEGDSYKSDSADPQPGSGGQREFKYKARAPGTTTITFYDCYRCGTSSTVSPENSALAKRITFTVTVS